MLVLEDGILWVGSNQVEVGDVPHDEVPDRCWNSHQNNMVQSEGSLGQEHLVTSSEDLLF